MVEMRQLSASLSVAPQISEADVAELAAQGFRSVINNRPDGEGEGQPPSEVMAAACARHGLEYRYLPVIPGGVMGQNGADFAALLGSLPGPILAYCRSGARCTSLWNLAQAHSGNRAG